MTQRDKFKGQLIGRVMAQTGCTFEQAELCYEQIWRHVWKPVVSLAVGMIARKVLREFTGKETVSTN